VDRGEDVDHLGLVLGENIRDDGVYVFHHPRPHASCIAMMISLELKEHFVTFLEGVCLVLSRCVDASDEALY
jgi:hypothetical protein